jgi:excisionase family DNA binding protein
MLTLDVAERPFRMACAKPMNLTGTWTKMAEMVPRMLRIKEVAQRLNCSVASVYVLVEKTLLPSVTIGPAGGGVRVLEADLAAFIESRRRLPPPVQRKLKKERLKFLR